MVATPEEREAALAEALAKARELLQEVHHRTRNNLQVIATLMDIEAAGADPAAQPVLARLRRRVGELGRLHENLYGGGAAVELGGLLSQIYREVAATADPTGAATRMPDLGEAVLPIGKALALGLLLDELLERAFAVALMGQPPTGVALYLDGDADLGFAGLRLVLDPVPGAAPGAMLEPSLADTALCQALLAQLGARVVAEAGGLSVRV